MTSITNKQRDAIADALGYEPDPEIISRAIDEYGNATVAAMEADLSQLREQFDNAGGRGIELAENIDALEIALAYRINQ